MRKDTNVVDLSAHREATTQADIGEALELMTGYFDGILVRAENLVGVIQFQRDLLASIEPDTEPEVALAILDNVAAELANLEAGATCLAGGVTQ